MMKTMLLQVLADSPAVSEASGDDSPGGSHEIRICNPRTNATLLRCSHTSSRTHSAPGIIAALSGLDSTGVGESSVDTLGTPYSDADSPDLKGSPGKVLSRAHVSAQP